MKLATALAALAATVIVAGCGSDDTKTTSAAAKKSDPYSYDYGTQKETATPGAGSETGVALTVKAANGMLADGEGRTLYLWEADQGDQSACDGPCAEAWPPLTSDGAPQAGDGVK